MEELFAAHPVLWAIALVVASLAGLGRSWLAHRTAVRREEEHTRRIELAVAQTSNAHRAAVIRAAGQLAPVIFNPARPISPRNSQPQSAVRGLMAAMANRRGPGRPA